MVKMDSKGEKFRKTEVNIVPGLGVGYVSLKILQCGYVLANPTINLYICATSVSFVSSIT